MRTKIEGEKRPTSYIWGEELRMTVSTREERRAPRYEVVMPLLDRMGGISGVREARSIACSNA